jgi:hypothetical protein
MAEELHGVKEATLMANLFANDQPSVGGRVFGLGAGERSLPEALCIVGVAPDQTGFPAQEED